MLVVINNRDLLTWPKAMAEKLQGQGHEVVILDNASTYEPTLDWYSKGEQLVIPLPINMGHHAPWTICVDRFRDEEYVVTDPDLDISRVPSDWAEKLSNGLKFFEFAPCIGLSLDDTKIPEENPAWIDDDFRSYPDGNSPQCWGNASYHTMRGHECGSLDWYNMPVDTTFAVYRKGVFTGEALRQEHFAGGTFESAKKIDGIRAGRPYTARHMPWHIVTELTGNPDKIEYLLDDELRYYFAHANEGLTYNPSTTTGRMKKYGLLKRREHANQ